MSVTLTFLGAAREVTGSCILVQTAHNRFLVDCGMFQGGGESDRKNARRMPVPPASIDFVLSTHAHIDHSGLLPKLVRDGFRGPIHCTSATADLLGVMLPDAGHIQEREAEWQTRKRKRGGKREVSPLYTEADALAVLPALRPVPYGKSIAPGPGVSAAFLDAGHILGSAILTVTVADEGKEKKLVFSGDLGHRGLPIVRDPATVPRADALVIESTYGNRIHKGMVDTVEEFVHAVDDTLRRKKGNVIIVGFQAQGTLGRKIVDGAKRVRVFGEEIAVAADVYTIGGLSAHADRDDLLAWAGRFKAPPGNVFVAHGEESVSLEFAGTLNEKLGWRAQVPSPGQPLVLQ